MEDMKALGFLAVLALLLASAPLSLAASAPVPIVYCDHYFYSLQYATASGTPPGGCLYATSYDSSYSPSFVEYRYASTSAGGQFVNDLKWVSSGASNNVTAISDAQVQFRMGGSGSLFYYFPANVTQVEYSQTGSTPTVFQTSSFFSSQAQFNSASSPKVFANSTFIEVNVPSASYVYFDLNSPQSSSNGGSTPGGSGTSPSSPPRSPVASIPPGMVLIAVIFIVALYAYSKYSDKQGKKGNPWRSPRKGPA